MNSVFGHLFLIWRFGISGLLFEQIRSMGKKVLVFFLFFLFCDEILLTCFVGLSNEKLDRMFGNEEFLLCCSSRHIGCVRRYSILFGKILSVCYSFTGSYSVIINKILSIFLVMWKLRMSHLSREKRARRIGKF